MRRTTLALTVAALAFIGCTSQNPAATDPSVQPAAALTYYQGSDEYRCFVIDPHLMATFNMIAVGVHSTNPAIVHHTIVYAQLPQYQAAVDTLDANDPLPGYECFGGAGWAGAIPVGAAAVG